MFFLRVCPSKNVVQSVGDRAILSLTFDATKYRSKTLGNSQRGVSRASFSRKTRFWTLFCCRRSVKCSKHEDVGDRTQIIAKVRDPVRWSILVACCPRMSSFEHCGRLVQQNRVQKRVFREKLALDTPRWLFPSVFDRYFVASKVSDKIALWPTNIGRLNYVLRWTDS